MKRRRNVIYGGALVAAIAALGVGQARLEALSSAQPMVETPIFEVDPLWPKPLPNGWLLGTVIGVGVDSRDHVFIVHRGNITAREAGAAQDPPVAECCSAAPPVLEFDPQGNLVNAWGGPVEGAPYVWPNSNHGVGIDLQDNIWIGGNGQGDSHVLVFTRNGQFIRQIGIPGRPRNSNATDHYSMVAKVAFDFPNNEAYFADGYSNKRVAVVDMATGQLKRYWGAYGNRPVDDYEYTDNRAVGQNWRADQNPQQQFRNPVHCAEPSRDGFIYVCDRQNNRIQVFNREGRFVREGFYAPETLGDGAVWEIAFSKDPQQRYMYVADGKNARIRIVERESMQEISTVGSGGRYPGQFQAVHSIATDSRGNIFITETYEGRRVQKFTYRGIGQAARHQGAAWPRR
jgi:DNA-binding beta-propeller fold protein YncE